MDKVLNDRKPIELNLDKVTKIKSLKDDWFSKKKLFKSSELISVNPKVTFIKWGKLWLNLIWNFIA